MTKTAMKSKTAAQAEILHKRIQSLQNLQTSHAYLKIWYLPCLLP